MVCTPKKQKEGDKAPATCSTGTTRWLPTSAGASPTSPESWGRFSLIHFPV